MQFTSVVSLPLLVKEIESRRKQIGLTKRGLAYRAGISERSYYSILCGGSCSADILLELLTAVEVEICLVEHSKSPENKKKTMKFTVFDGD